MRANQYFCTLYFFKWPKAIKIKPILGLVLKIPCSQMTVNTFYTQSKGISFIWEIIWQKYILILPTSLSRVGTLVKSRHGIRSDNLKYIYISDAMGTKIRNISDNHKATKNFRNEKLLFKAQKKSCAFRCIL